jgi:hypothetical protein
MEASFFKANQIAATAFEDIHNFQINDFVGWQRDMELRLMERKDRPNRRYFLPNIQPVRSGSTGGRRSNGRFAS